MTNKNMQKPVLSKEVMHRLSYALAELFFGLSRSNWTQSNQMLGSARQKALEQIDAFLSSKDSANPAVVCLQQIMNTRRAELSKIIMQSNRSVMRINLPDNVRQNSIASGTKWVNAALGKLNQTIKECDKSKEVIQLKSADDKIGQIDSHNSNITHKKMIELIQKSFLDGATR